MSELFRTLMASDFSKFLVIMSLGFMFSFVVAAVFAFARILLFKFQEARREGGAELLAFLVASLFSAGFWGPIAIAALAYGGLTDDEILTFDKVAFICGIIFPFLYSRLADRMRRAR